METPSKATERPARRRPWVRRLILILGLPAVILAGWKAAPRIETRIRLHLAERALAAGRLDESEALLDLLISEEPRQTKARLLRAEVLRRLGRITEAEEALQRAVELGLPIEQGRREHALLRVGADFAKSEKSLRQILETHPEDDEVRQALNERRSQARP